MNAINGKVLVFTDQHFGIKGNSQLRQKIGILAIKHMLDCIKAEKIQNVIFMGDYFHSRALISSDTINIAYKCMQSIAKKCRTILILGNHDLFMKNSVDINSLNMFQDIPNVEIVSQPSEVDINSKKCLLIPWLSDLSNYKSETYDMMFGHFDISTKYLIQSYIEQNKSKNEATSELKNEISQSLGVQTSNLVGNFVDLCKMNGTIFAGHIHQHKEFISKQRNFIFVGSPYQQTLGDIGNDTGYYVIDENSNYEFKKISTVPIHIQLKMSQILKDGIETFDYSIVKNNIVQRIYDVDVNVVDDQKITQKIFMAKPYEELLPEYQVDITTTISNKTETNTIELIRKSKLEYIHNYIESIDQTTLDEQNIDREKLFTILEKYYKAATE